MEVMIILLCIFFLLIIVAFFAGLYYGHKEGYVIGKMDGVRESNIRIKNML
jgi:uncharacterized protein HemY